MTKSDEKLLEQIEERYQMVRVMCLRHGNLHPDSKEVCHQALETKAAINLPASMHSIASVLDDAILLIRKQSELLEMAAEALRFYAGGLHYTEFFEIPLSTRQTNSSDKVTLINDCGEVAQQTLLTLKQHGYGKE